MYVVPIIRTEEREVRTLQLLRYTTAKYIRPEGFPTETL